MDNLTPHKHASLIKAWADGAQIEFYSISKNDWLVLNHPLWQDDVRYRIKEAPKPDKVMEALIVLSPFAGPMLYPASSVEANCELVFDGTTNKLKECRLKGF